MEFFESLCGGANWMVTLAPVTRKVDTHAIGVIE